MKYREYSVEDFVKDDYFQKWVLDSDRMTANFWTNWLSQNPDKKEEIQRAREAVRLLAGDEDQLTKADFDAMWQHIVENRNTAEKEMLNSPGRYTKNARKIFIRIAAAILGLIALSSGLYISGIFDTGENNPKEYLNAITLQLNDGTIKVIDEDAHGTITTGGGQVQAFQESKTLIYDDNEQSNKERILEFNELTVPYGKTFQVKFSDGSYALLNAGSKLRYPVSFLEGHDRNVFLDGEAYFNVAKDSLRTFTVVTDHMNTEVYGTTFNVSSYKNENNTFTVLLEGSVGVYQPNNPEGGNPVKIIPGQRAIFEKGNIGVEQVNVHKYTAWTMGELNFMDDRFEQIVKELERHFDVEIVNRYEGLNDKRFTGTFTTESIEQILKVCQAHTPFSFEKTDNVITIQKKSSK
ncbi:FecR domain-containing protein [Galbibacter sp. PAP.153]|uniref:FecR family protein n=1 Tax=Galbibacter sp. PAP.153 TaxID=3104623 RepID=UPI0030087C67